MKGRREPQPVMMKSKERTPKPLWKGRRGPQPDMMKKGENHYLPCQKRRRGTTNCHDRRNYLPWWKGRKKTWPGGTIGETGCTVKKRFASFPSPAGMSLPNSPWAGIMTAELKYSCPGGVWLVTSRLDTGNSWTFFYGVPWWEKKKD